MGVGLIKKASARNIRYPQFNIMFEELNPADLLLEEQVHQLK